MLSETLSPYWGGSLAVKGYFLSPLRPFPRLANTATPAAALSKAMIANVITEAPVEARKTRLLVLVTVVNYSGVISTVFNVVIDIFRGVSTAVISVISVVHISSVIIIINIRNTIVSVTPPFTN